MPLYEKKGRYIIDFADIPTERARMSEIPVSERNNNFKEVETGFTQYLAVAEAKRCLSCRRCLGCALCWAECKPEAIDFDRPDSILELEVSRVILTSGVEQNIKPVPADFDKRYVNVITDLQAERMLARTGPTNGIIIRPYDGEIPKRIAFVQTSVPADRKVSKSILTFGINEALIWERRIDEAEISLISPILSTINEVDENGLSDINLVEATITAMAEAGQDCNVELTYVVNEARKMATFNLVVLLTEPVLSASIQEVARKMGVEAGCGVI